MSVTFGPSGSVAWNVHNSATDGSGRRSARWTTGFTGLTTCRWRAAFTNGASAATPGRAVFLYLIEATNPTGAADEGPMDHQDGSMSLDQRRNLTPFGYVVADATGAGSVYRKWSYFETTAPYLQVACFNDLGVDLSTTSGAHWLELSVVS